MTGDVGAWEKLVSVEHRFGSAIFGAITVAEPNLARALILTGM